MIPVPRLNNSASQSSTPNHRHGNSSQMSPNRHGNSATDCANLSSNTSLLNLSGLTQQATSNRNNSAGSASRRFKQQPPPPQKVWVEYDLHASYTESIFESKYQIVSLIGQGSFGDVFKVFSAEEKQYYAIKKITKQYKNAADRDLKLREALKHSKLPKHVNLIQFYGYWEENNCLFIKTELCAHNLSLFLSKGQTLSYRRTIIYLIDILSGLKVLHDKFILHMDLKPDNIFLSIGGICKIGDFGLSYDMKNDTQSCFMEGDPRYLALEVLQSGIVSRGADIFSLGLTMIELTSGQQLPRNGDLWHKIRNPDEEPDFILNHLNYKIKAIIKSMIEFDHKSRPDCETLIMQLENLQCQCSQIMRSNLSFLTEKASRALVKINIFLLDRWPFKNWLTSDMHTPQRPNMSMFNWNNTHITASNRKPTQLTSPQISKNLTSKFTPLSVEKKQKEMDVCRVNLRDSFTADNEE